MLNTAKIGDEADARSRVALSQMIEGYRATALVHVAARLRIADQLCDGAKDADALAAATETHLPSLRRLLRGLAVLGIVREVEDGGFELTPLGMPLRKDAPQSLRGRALRAGDEIGMRVWGDLFHTVKTGETAFDHVFGMGSFDYLARNPETFAAFNRAMVVSTRQAAPAILAAYDFSQFARIVDVGGGSGAFIAAILQANPGVLGVVFDLPAGTEGAATLLEQAGVAGRCEIIAGDFFSDALPRGADAYVVKSVIDDWDDGRAVSLLKNCRHAIASNGRLVLIAPVMPDELDTSEAVHATVMFDLNMMVSSGGRERTKVEFAALFAAAGFKLTAFIPAGSEILPYSVVEGVPV